MGTQVQQILIIAAAVVIVALLAMVLGRRLRVAWGDKSLQTDRGRPTMSMSATQGGSIADGKQIAEGEVTADMNMNASQGTLKKVEQHSGDRPETLR